MKIIIIIGCILSFIWMVAVLENDKAQGHFWAAVLCLLGFVCGGLAIKCHAWWIWIFAGIAWAVTLFFLFIMFIFRKVK